MSKILKAKLKRAELEAHRLAEVNEHIRQKNTQLEKENAEWKNKFEWQHKAIRASRSNTGFLMDVLVENFSLSLNLNPKILPPEVTK